MNDLVHSTATGDTPEPEYPESRDFARERPPLSLRRDSPPAGPLNTARLSPRLLRAVKRECTRRNRTLSECRINPDGSVFIP